MGTEVPNVASHQQTVHELGAGDGAQNEYAKWLGPPTGGFRPQFNDVISYVNRDLPHYYKGSNMYLADMVRGMIMENNRWPTEVALPWSLTEQISVQWTLWIARPAVVGRVPHEGLSRMVTHREQTRRKHSVRRGQALRMESDFYRTPEGVQNYLRKLRQISQNVQETQDADTIEALLSANDYNALLTAEFGMSEISYQEILDREIFAYACAADPDGDKIMNLILDSKRAMMKDNITPTMVITGPKLNMHLHLLPPGNWEYYRAGPDGRQQKMNAPLSNGEIKGTKLQAYEVRDFTYQSGGTPIQLLHRRSQIAEYNVYPAVVDGDCSHFCTSHRDIEIYDENRDDMVVVEFRKAFMHSMLFDVHNGGGYHHMWRAEVASYNAMHRAPHVHEGDAAHVRRHGDKHVGSAPPFFLATYNDGVWGLAQRFGDMQPYAATPMHMQRVGESCQNLFGGPTQAAGAFQDLVNLVSDIEQAPYNEAFLRALIRANTPAGGFVGERTPADLAEAWGTPQILEWKPNANGGLDLPMDPALAGLRVPLGYANWPGLLTLAEHADNPGSPWHEAGKRAKVGVSFISTVVGQVQKAFPLSDAVNVDNRAPWFHRPDANTVFFSNVFGVPRDPLFLMSLPGVGGGAAEPGAAEPGAAPRWFALPGVTLGLDTQVLVRDDVDQLRRDLETVAAGGVPPAGSAVTLASPGDRIVMYSPTLGRDIELPAALYRRGATISRELTAFAAMPAGDAGAPVRAAHLRIENAISDPDNYAGAGAPDPTALRRKYQSFVARFGQRGSLGMWQVVLALDRTLAVSGFADLARDVNDIAIEAGDSQEAIAAKTARIGELEEVGAARRPAGLSAATPTLQASWVAAGVFPRAAAGADEDIIGGVAADVQSILDNEAEIARLARAAGRPVPDFPRPISEEAVAAARAAAAALGTDAATAAATAVGDSYATVAGALVAAGVPPEALEPAPAPATPGVVFTGPGAVAGGQYYRAPLTSSRALVASISEQFGGREARPLVLPSDPDVAHVRPVDGGARVPEAIWRRLNYAPIGDLAANVTERDSSVTDVARRFASTSAVALDAEGHASAPAATLTGGADDGGDDDDEDLDVFFGASSAAKRQRYAARADVAPFSAAAGAYGRAPADVSSPVFRQRWADANQIADPLVRLCTLTFLLTDCSNVKSWTTMMDNNIYVPIGIIIWRMRIEHTMQSMIVMRAGSQTGANLFGHSNFQLGVNAQDKTFEGNYTFYAHAVVWDDRAVHTIRDVKAMGYRGGSNTVFATRPEDFDRTDSRRPSLVATVVPATFEEDGSPLYFGGSLTEAFPEMNTSIDGTPGISYPTAKRYDDFWGFGCRRHDKTSLLGDTYFTRAKRFTAVAVRSDAVVNFGGKRHLHRGRGHRSGKVYPGAAPIWNGNASVFKDYDWGQIGVGC
jgi:hypothetical protein